jgi:CMP-N,N'-diacetyllegionaminic acid synthase
VIDGRSILAIIPARGGSKGVPRKNLRQLAGKPLIAWTIDAAKAAQHIDRVILSSDDDEIIATAQMFGCEVPFVRPRELGDDHVPTAAVIAHALEHLPAYDYVILLQPTSPLRAVSDIETAIEQCVASGAAAVVSVCEAEHHPAWMYYLDDTMKMQPALPALARPTRRQELRPCYRLNGAIYVFQTTWFLRSLSFVDEHTRAFVMPLERSIDIDSEQELTLCELLMKGRRDEALQSCT